MALITPELALQLAFLLTVALILKSIVDSVILKGTVAILHPALGPVVSLINTK